MPLLDSFKVDHVKMTAPAVRIAKKMNTKCGDPVTVYDLRFCRPNIDQISEKGIHTLEHLFAGFIREHLKGDDVEIIDVSPMGCRTGFYMSTIGCPSEERIIKAWSEAMKDIIAFKGEENIPELNVHQCGTYKMHSLKEAQETARKVIDAGIGVMNNEDLLLSDEQLKSLGN